MSIKDQKVRDFWMLIDAGDQIIDLRSASEDVTFDTQEKEILVGTNFFEYVVDAETKGFYKLLFRFVRSSRTIFSHEYRCDSPEWARFFNMNIEPQRYPSSLHLKLNHKMDFFFPHDSEEIPFEEMNLNRCSQCLRCDIDGDWIFVAPSDKIINEYTVCEHCRNHAASKVKSGQLMRT